MRSPVRKHLNKTFRKEFEKRFPGFRFLKLPRGSVLRIWEWRIAAGLVFYLGIQPFPNEDSFVLEIAWTTDGEFPWHVVEWPNMQAPRGRERLGKLWKRFGDEPVWDAAPEMAEAQKIRFAAMLRREDFKYDPPPDVDIVIPRIAPLVDDALRKFQEYGIPLFEEVARNQGIPDLSEYRKS